MQKTFPDNIAYELPTLVDINKRCIYKKGDYMKRLLFLLVTLISIVCINWRTAETTIEGNLKQTVNFYGRLITHQGKEYKVDNISISGKYKQIAMYDKPRQYPKPTLNPTTNQREIVLKLNPKNNFITSKIDLSEIGEIRVPKPNIIWVYQREGRGRRLEYIEITIISKNKKKTKNSYLLERTTKVRCDEVNVAGPVEKIVPLSAINKLIIEGYSLRDNIDTKSQNNTRMKKQKNNGV